jgi:hypothetical protein
MGQKGLVVCLFIFGVLISARSMHGQNFEASGNGGFGVAERDGFGIPGVPSGGGTLGWPSASTHKVQFDYAFGHMERNLIHYNRHFFTGSYVIQPRPGRTRPFLQFGAGVQYETNNANQVVGRDLFNDSRTVFTGVLGAGVTIELGHSAFIRPEVRTYLALGENRTINVTALPCLGLGRRF